jgi:hypothetical protein
MNPAMLIVFLEQKTTKVLVGDPNQQVRVMNASDLISKKCASSSPHRHLHSSIAFEKSSKDLMALKTSIF